MKKALMKDAIKEIKNTYRRFISILLMAFLGVGFFAGLRASSPDMLNTIDKYYKDNNVYDIQVMSTLGLTNEDVEALKKVENVEGVYGTYTQDAIINIDEVESVAKILCVEEINKPVLVDGRLAENESECVVEELFMRANNKKIGDKIEIQTEDTTDDEGNKSPFLKNKELEIVGVAKSPLYISMEKGTSKLGAGRVNYYIYVNDKNINVKDVYTEIYIKAKNSEKFVTSTEEYEDYIENVKVNIEEIKQEREQARHDMLVNKANEKVNEAQKTFDEEKANAEKQIADAEKQIKDARIQFENGQSEINLNKDKAKKEFASAQKQINNAKNQISSGEAELQTKEQEANKQIEGANNKKAELQQNLNSINAGLNQVESGLADVNKSLQNPYITKEQKQQIEITKKSLEDKKKELEGNKIQLENGIAQIDQGIKSGQNELVNAKQTLNNSKAQLKEQEEKFIATKNSTYAKLDEAQKTLDSSKTKLSEGEAELEKNKQEFNQKISDAEGELIDARDKISEIENATWYILDRNSNQGYVGFINDTKSIDSLGTVFPLVFFVIATLISLTSMTRMVEEQRTQIGTLKALGYKKIQIASKYVIYASLACVIGGLLGMQIGCAFLPRIVWKMYSMMYSIENFVVKFNAFYGFMGLFAAFVCIVGATIYATYKELINTPAVLMRPKAPKTGKRVLLEHIPIIWNHLSFTRKVTVRNLFRYKKRFLMTIIGILGCTALILVGFGIKDSITSLIPKQYEDVFRYNMQISLKSNLEENQRKKIMEEIESKEEVNEIVETNISTGKLLKDENNLKSKNVEIQIIAPKDNNVIEKVVNLRDRDTHEKISLEDMKENEILISDKAADLINVKQGDTVIIRDSDDIDRKYIISGIVENYVGHYAYMTKSLYEKSFEKNYETNVLYLKNQDMTQEEEDKFVKEFVDKNEVSAVNAISTTTKTIGDMMTSLNYVVIILIVSAGILAFVVLYNLSNVNISERIRELSTIKVLGFYDKEVYNYISRETVILTSIGIILGCIGGYFLNSFILATCELESMRFGKFIKPESYVFSILITIVFTLIVNIVTYFSLKKIDMIESLKSVE